MGNNDCTCDWCQDACKVKPGWFAPGEVEKAAEFVGMPLADFFKEKLAVDWWQSDPDIFLLSPAVVGGESGEEFPADPRGVCVFFKEGRCSIHAAKPMECRLAHHDNAEWEKVHKDTAMLWKGAVQQQQIVDLLGREPYAEEADIFTSLLWGL